jgi:hypothetical protein
MKTSSTTSMCTLQVAVVDRAACAIRGTGL